MKRDPHRIRRLRIRASAPTQAKAFELRTHLRHEVEPTLLPMIEKVFDEFSPGEEVLHIPKLEIRVKVPDLDELPAVLPELVRKEIRDRLSQHPPNDAKDESSFSRIEGARSRVEALVHYLRTGALPWSYEQGDNTANREWLQSAFAEDAVRAAVAALNEAPLDRERIALYFRALMLLPEKAWASLAEVVVPNEISRLHPIAPVAESTPAPMRAHASEREIDTTTAPTPPFVSEIPPKTAKGTLAPDRAQELETALVALGDTSKHSRYVRLMLSAMAMAAIQAKPDSAIAEPIATLLVEVFGGGPARPAMELVELLPEGARPLFRRLLSVPAPAAIRDSIPTPFVSPAPTTRTPDMEPFATIATCAGLVLVHPYLSRFFDTLGIERSASGGISEPALPRAAALLFFLATGEEETLEHELGFIKVLLGKTPRTPLPIAAGLLREGDREETEGLLSAVIEHFAALKGTSIAGLRASFLMRKGLLREEETRYRLQVETASFDMLLGRLPWGIGIVKLPWMKKPIFTEWPTP